MEAVLIVLVAMAAFDALVFLAFPGAVKRWVGALSPSELRIVGALELLIVAAVVYYIVVGW